MLEFTEKALILKVGRFRESDLWVRLFSPNRGILTAFAFGGSRSVRRFCGCLDPFNHVLFRIKGSRRGDYLYLMEGTLLGGWPRLRSDIPRQGQAVNCIKFFEAVQIGPQGSRRAYDLLLETMDILESRENVSAMFPLLFRAKLAFDQGYAPGLSACPRCGKDLMDSVAPQFLVEHGQIVCDDCRPAGGRGISLGPDSLEILRRVRDHGPGMWSETAPPSKVRRQCFDAVDAFVRYHLGLAWEDGRFRRV